MTLKKKIIYLLIPAFIFINSSPTTANDNFNDVADGAWYEYEINFLSQTGIVSGYPDGSFKPDTPLQADHFIKMLLVSLGYCEDNAAGYWADNYIKKALALGFITENMFDSYTRGITREEMAVILSNTMHEIPGITISSSEPVFEYGLYAYMRCIKDLSMILYNQTPVLKAFASGIITGYPDGTFRPYNILTRAEACAVIIRIIDPSKRIYPDDVIPEVPDIKQTVEDIEFDFEKDFVREERSKDCYVYYMSLDKTKEFTEKFLSSMVFQKDGTITGYVPCLPDGFRWDINIGAQYKSSVAGEGIDKYGTEDLITNFTNVILQGDNFNVKTIKEMKYIEYIWINCSIYYNYLLENAYIYGRYCFPKEEYTLEFNGNEIKYDVSWEVHLD